MTAIISFLTAAVLAGSADSAPYVHVAVNPSVRMAIHRIIFRHDVMAKRVRNLRDDYAAV
jgi:hypothetical protein